MKLFLLGTITGAILLACLELFVLPKVPVGNSYCIENSRQQLQNYQVYVNSPPNSNVPEDFKDKFGDFYLLHGVDDGIPSLQYSIEILLYGLKTTKCEINSLNAGG